MKIERGQNQRTVCKCANYYMFYLMFATFFPGWMSRCVRWIWILHGEMGGALVWTRIEFDWQIKHGIIIVQMNAQRWKIGCSPAPNMLWRRWLQPSGIKIENYDEGKYRQIQRIACHKTGIVIASDLVYAQTIYRNVIVIIMI